MGTIIGHPTVCHPCLVQRLKSGERSSDLSESLSVPVSPGADCAAIKPSAGKLGDSRSNDDSTSLTHTHSGKGSSRLDQLPSVEAITQSVGGVLQSAGANPQSAGGVTQSAGGMTQSGGGVMQSARGLTQSGEGMTNDSSHACSSGPLKEGEESKAVAPLPLSAELVSPAAAKAAQGNLLHAQMPSTGQ